MPLPGDQHRGSTAIANPFAEQRTHVTEYTAQEIATLQSRLDRQLGPEYISTRPGAGGGKVHYIAAEKVIQLANEVFGFNGWSSSIQNVQIDFVDENSQSGKITLGLSTIVRVTLRDGSFHEDIGYGHIENCKGKAAAFEKAKKEATTDALKRALRNFGNVLGNCLYDKDYLKRVEKIKIAPSRWDAENLHRHPDFAPLKQEAATDRVVQQEDVPTVRRQTAQHAESFGTAEFDDEFGGNLLDETDFSHPDEVRIEDTSPTKKAISVPPPVSGPGSMSRLNSMPQLRPPGVPVPQPPPTLQQLQRTPVVRPPPPRPAHVNPGPADSFQAGSEMLKANTASGPTTVNSFGMSAQFQQQHETSLATNQNQEYDAEGFPIPRDPPPGCPEGFVSSRSTHLQPQPPDKRPAHTTIAFNPHAESPSIRRTHGVNPGKSTPIMRQAIDGGRSASPKPSQGIGLDVNATSMRTNFVNPSADTNRRIGMPPAPNGLQNRGQYKPPTSIGVKRPPLNDISNSVQSDGNADAKKTRTDGDSKSMQTADGNAGQFQPAVHG